MVHVASQAIPLKKIGIQKRKERASMRCQRRGGLVPKIESTFRVEVEVVTLTAHSVSKSASHGDNEKGRQRPLPKQPSLVGLFAIPSLHRVVGTIRISLKSQWL